MRYAYLPVQKGDIFKANNGLWAVDEVGPNHVVSVGIGPGTEGWRWRLDCPCDADGKSVEGAMGEDCIPVPSVQAAIMRPNLLGSDLRAWGLRALGHGAVGAVLGFALSTLIGALVPPSMTHAERICAERGLRAVSAEKTSPLGVAVVCEAKP